METNERLARLEAGIENIKEGNSEIRESIKDIHHCFSNLNKMYSGKWVEKVILAVVISIAVGIFTFIPNACSRKLIKTEIVK